MNENIKTLMFDLSEGREIFDAEQDRVIPTKEANEYLAKFCREELGLNEYSTNREMKRALKSQKGIELMQVIEEVVDYKIKTGWQENEFFNQFVESRNLADGDKNEFWVDQDVILTVARVSGDHHDLTVQRLGAGSSTSLPMSVFAVKVGAFIRDFLLGRKDWSQYTDAVAKAYLKKIQDELYTEFMAASQQIPATSQFNKTGALGAATKDIFDTLIEDVSMTNDNAPVVIMGTKTALKKLNGLVEYGNAVTWTADSQKESIAHTGLIGDYEGTALMEIPQRFANNDIATKLVDNGKLLIMPLVDTKPVKFVDGGETEVTVDQIAQTMDDRQTYEVTRRMGIGTYITNYFGVWNITTTTM